MMGCNVEPLWNFEDWAKGLGCGKEPVDGPLWVSQPDMLCVCVGANVTFARVESQFLRERQTVRPNGCMRSSRAVTPLVLPIYLD